MGEGIKRFDPRKYISREAFENLTVVMSSEDDDLYKQAIMLKDGTSIIIEKPRKDIFHFAQLLNPHGIDVIGPCSVIISYQKNKISKTEVSIRASSNEELINGWKKYREDRALAPDIVGTIEEVQMTPDQALLFDDVKSNMNEILNRVLDKNVDITKTYFGRPSDEEIDREVLGVRILSMVFKCLLMSGEADKLHFPVSESDSTGTIIKIHEYIDANIVDGMR